MGRAAGVDVPYTSAAYFGLVEQGILAAEDRVELLDGVIVAMSPQSPRHASATRRVARVLRIAVGEHAVISVQSPFVAGPRAVPEPDVAVLPGADTDYDDVHPSTALLIVEVADASLPQDRLSKARIYAGAGCPEYWIVNLRDDCVEVFRAPNRRTRTYARHSTARPGEHLILVAVRRARVSVDELLPARK
jgi:Uma2 family endonuclease